MAYYAFITKSVSLTDWWHYLPNAYIVSTQLNSKQLADQIIRNFSGLLFFITKVDLSDNNGLLNKDAWTWINNKNNAKIKLKAIPRPPPKTIEQLLGSRPKPISTRNSYLDALFHRLKEETK